MILGSNQAVPLLNPAELTSNSFQSIGGVTSSDQFPRHLDNLHSLSDFFDGGDTILSTERHLERELARSHKSENLESSGLFTSDLGVAQTARHNPPRVLIVESSANVRRYLAMTLSRSGFLTEQAQDGKQAIAYLRECLATKQNVDLVITDLEMPHMQGFNLLSNIRADIDMQNLPIVVLTSNNESDQKLALELGANAYFRKPYREQELVAKLHKIISG